MTPARRALSLVVAASVGGCSLPDYPAWRGANDVVDASQDEPHEAPDILRADVVSADLIFDAPSDATLDDVVDGRTVVVDATAPVDADGGGLDAAVPDVPRDVAMDLPRDVATDVPRDAVMDVPRDVGMDIPRDTPVDATRDAAIDAPRDVGPDACATPTLEPVEQIALGRNHTCARTADRRVWCWGADADGQLGDGVRTPAGRPRPLAVPCLGEVAQIALGDAHSCARLTDGTVRCWGANDAGQLGDGTMTVRASPVTVVASDGRPFGRAVEIAAGARHTCARRDDGFAWCWGANDRGQIGDGSLTARTFPMHAGLFDDVTRIAAGGAHTCVLRRDAGAYCWGANESGQVGDGTTAMSRPIPAAVNASRSFVDIAAGASHNCARHLDGTVFCWGANASFQLGDRGGPRATPSSVAGAGSALSLAIGAGHSCAVRGDSTLRCWGANASGQVGDGTTMDRADPATVTTLGPVVEGAAGGGHTCVRLVLGDVRCWGGNAFGQLGDGTNTARTRPVVVTW